VANSTPRAAPVNPSLKLPRHDVQVATGNFIRQPVVQSAPPPPAATQPIPPPPAVQDAQARAPERKDELPMPASPPPRNAFRAAETNQALPQFSARGGPSQAMQVAGALRAADASQQEELKTAGSMPMLQCAILRGNRQSPLGTPLDTGETVRLRVTSVVDGTLAITEGAKTIAGARVERFKPYETGPLPFAGVGTRELRVTFTDTAGVQAVLPVTLIYR
jgi:hypothetical protein